MKLSEYLYDNQMSIVEFGRVVNIHPSQLSRYINGKNKPSIEQAHRIFIASKKKVTIKDWVQDEAKSSIEAKKS